jgi:hypothetical protein
LGKWIGELKETPRWDTVLELEGEDPGMEMITEEADQVEIDREELGRISREQLARGPSEQLERTIGPIPEADFLNGG